MKESDLVSTMTVRYASEGESAVVAGANTVAAAQDKVAASANALGTATESSSRRQASAASSFDQLASRMSPANRAMADLQRNIDAYSRALASSSTMTDRAGNGLDVYLQKINAQRTAVEALIRQQEILASQQRAADSTPVRTQDAINKSFGIDQVAPPSSAKASASAFFSQADIQAATRAQDEQTASLQRLRAAMNPLEAEQGKLGAQSAIYNAALKSGAITAAEYAVAQEMLGGKLRLAAGAAEGAGTAHSGLSSQAQAAGHAVRSMAEQIALGISPTQALTGQINHLSYAASGEGGLTGAFGGIASMIGPTGLIIGGLAATAAAFLALNHAISATAQEVEASKSRFAALGDAKLGEEYSRGLEQLRKDLHVTRDAVQPTYEALLKLDIPSVFGDTKISANAATDAIKGVFQELRLGGLDSKTAGDGTKKFFDGLISDAGLTGAALRRLQDLSPQFANALTFALTNGRNSVQQYAKALDAVPEPIQRILDVLPQLKQTGDAAFKSLQENPRTAGEAIDNLGVSLANLVRGNEAAAQGQAAASIFTVMLTQLDHAAIGLTQFNKDGTEQLRAFNESAIQYLGIREATAALSSGLAEADASITSFAQSANSALAGIVQSYGAALVAMGQVAAAAASGTAFSGGSGGAAAGSTDAMGGVMGGTGGSLTGYATGGQFPVRGPGGTDTELVQFMASPGEVVTITPPGATPPPNPAMGGASNAGGLMRFANGGQITLGGSVEMPTAAADVVAAHLADDTRQQTASLKDKLDQVASKIEEAVRASGIMISNAVTAALAKMAADAKAAADAAAQARTAANDNLSRGNGTSNGLAPGVFGTPGVSADGRFITYQAGLITGKGLLSGRYSPGGTYLNQMSGRGELASIGVVQGATFGGFGSGRVSGGSSGSSSASSQYEQPQMINDTPFYGSGVVGGQGASIGGFSGGSSGGGNQYDEGASFRDAQYPNLDGRLFGYRDPAGTIAPFTGMAAGGTFIVPGATTAGSDSVNVAIKASPGERIMVLPPTEARMFDELKNIRRFNPEPLSSIMPALNDNMPGGGSNSDYSVMGGSAPPVAASGGGGRGGAGSDRPVIINVQQGVQADTFIRSRAEIQRAMR